MKVLWYLLIGLIMMGEGHKACGEEITTSYKKSIATALLSGRPQPLPNPVPAPEESEESKLLWSGLRTTSQGLVNLSLHVASHSKSSPIKVTWKSFKEVILESPLFENTKYQYGVSVFFEGRLRKQLVQKNDFSLYIVVPPWHEKGVQGFYLCLVPHSEETSLPPQEGAVPFSAPISFTGISFTPEAFAEGKFFTGSRGGKARIIMTPSEGLAAPVHPQDELQKVDPLVSLTYNPAEEARVLPFRDITEGRLTITFSFFHPTGQVRRFSHFYFTAVAKVTSEEEQFIRGDSQFKKEAPLECVSVFRGEREQPLSLLQ